MSSLGKTSTKSFGADLVDDIKETGTGIKNVFNKGKEKVTAALDASIDNPDGNIGTDLKALGQAFGAGAGTLSDIFGEVLKGGAKSVLTEGGEKAVKEGITKVATPIVNSKPIQMLKEKYDSLSDDEKRTVDGLLGVASLAADFTGAGVGAKGAKVAGKAAVETAEMAGKTAAKVAAPVVNAAKGTKDVVMMGAEALGRIPGKVAVNVAEKQAAREAVNTLPEGIARQAAQNGIEVPDVQTLMKVTDSVPAQKTIARELVDTAKAFAKGETKKNPIEVVGKPIVQRLQTLDKARGTVGKALGEVAKGLGEVTTKELASPVFDALKRVPGLSGLKVSQKGILDFVDTTLATSLTKSDRQAIQKIFVDAIKPGTGLSKHKLRQELFEVLGAAKKAGKELTDTQGKAFDAVREGLSKVLETKNVRYKELSNQFRKIIQPLQDMRKMMKTIPGAEEDILEMQAGLLARRLTSQAQSNPQVRQILRAMDAATGKKGMTTFKVEELQDLYNVLDKYYDITGKTGFQGQIKNALDKNSSGLFDFITKTVGGFAGETPAVRQKAIEDLLESILNKKK